MKLNRLLRRLLALLLTAAALMGLGGLSAPSPAAEAADVSIDTSKFIDPNDTKSTCYIYYWHKGIPPIEWNFRNLEEEGKEPSSYPKYPILLTWDSQYYLRIDQDFAETFQRRYGDDDSLVYYHRDGSASSSRNLFEEVHEEVHPYEMNKKALLADHPVYQQLQKSGLAVCLEEDVADLPFLTPASMWGRNEFLLGAPVIKDTMLDPVKLGYGSQLWSTALTGDDYVNWLVSEADLWEGRNGIYTNCGFGVLQRSAKTILNKDYKYNPRNVLWLSYLSPKLKKAKQDQKSYYNKHFATWFSTGEDFQFRRDSFIWDFVQASTYDDSLVAVYSSRGLYDIMIKKKGDFWSDKAINKARNKAHMQLEHDKSKFIVRPTENQAMTNKQKYQFRMYYAEPVIASIMKTGFTVQKGQAVNLDGPIVIDPGCTVTVEDGGVLSCAGWILNRGQILIQPGGTMIVQSLENDTGSAAYGTITNPDADPDSACGRIACDGKMIVMRDCKVCASGLYGLEFGDGAQVVNYGQIISENLSCKTDHTIENRGETSAVFAGWGVTDIGYELSQKQITGQDYPGKGTLQKTALVRMPQNTVYGEGADRLYVNGAASVTYTQPSPEKGYVSGFVAPMPVSDEAGVGIPQELPESYLVMRDPRYDVSFIEAEGTIYHYDSVVGRWVYVGEDGSNQIFNYAYGGELTDVDSLLPDGYILSDGRVVSSSDKFPPGGILYDVHENVYWIEDEEDSDVPFYYWEEALDRWVYVDLLNKYHLADEELGPPPNVGRDYISSEIYSDVPAGFRRYTAGMAESNGEMIDDDANAKPKVQYDEDVYLHYYIYYDNGEGSGVQQYWWDQTYMGFYMRSAYGVYGHGVSADEVDLNGFTLPGYEPPRPKVQYDGSAYFIVVDDKTYVWNKTYHWFVPSGKTVRIVGGVPAEGFGPTEVDMNGYTLP